jgi:transcriptional regulator
LVSTIDNNAAGGVPVAQRSDLVHGTLDMLILKTLALEPRHGWAISSRIRQVSQGALRVNQGSLYPSLQRLEAQGLIRGAWQVSDHGRNARVYRLTGAGRRRLEREQRTWLSLSLAVERVLRAEE